MGRSEEILGKALKDFAKRDEVVIATKVYFRMHEGPNGEGLSRKHIVSQVDQSLKRLGTDYIDLYIIHRWDYNTPIEETMETLHDLVKSGKVRYKRGGCWTHPIQSISIRKTCKRVWRNHASI